MGFDSTLEFHSKKLLARCNALLYLFYRYKIFTFDFILYIFIIILFSA